jgi:hypothetical protein
MSSDPQVAGLLNTDTDLETERQQIRSWRAMSGLDKLRAVAEMNAAVDTMALAGIRVRHPAASPREQFLRLAILKLGHAMASEAYPEISALDVT